MNSITIEIKPEESMPELPANTRKSPRYKTTLLARCEKESSMHECRGNVSAGGFCFESPTEIETGTRVEILFRLPGAGVWMSAKGVVLGCVRTDDTVGVRGRFVEIDMGDPDLLARWIESIAKLRQVAWRNPLPFSSLLFQDRVRAREFPCARVRSSGRCRRFWARRGRSSCTTSPPCAAIAAAYSATCGRTRPRQTTRFPPTGSSRCSTGPTQPA